MKHIITSLFLIGITTTQVLAQPVLNPSSMPAAGFSTNFYIGDSTGAGPAGANVTWDFGALTYGNGGTISVVDPTTTDFYSKYNTANLCLEIEAMGFTIYNYYKADANALSKLGEGVSDAIPSEIDYLNNNKVWLKFPFNFNDVVIDGWRGATSNGTDTIWYDGYGTLITPFDTFTNVIRTRTISADSTYGLDTTYAWFATSPAIFEIMEMTDGESIILEEMPTVTTGVNTVSKKNALRVYPNPAKDYITIDAGKIQGTLTIFDLNGRSLKQTTVSGQPATVTTTDLKPGIYFYNLTGTNSQQYKGSFTIN